MVYLQNYYAVNDPNEKEYEKKVKVYGGIFVDIKLQEFFISDPTLSVPFIVEFDPKPAIDFVMSF